MPKVIPSWANGSADRRRLAIAALSVAAHLGVLMAFISAQPAPLETTAPEFLPVQMVEAPRPPPPPAPKPAPTPAPSARAPTTPSPARPAPRRTLARRTPVPPDVIPLPAGKSQTADSDGVSDAQLASAADAGGGSGSGAGGGACDMARRLQDALRKDPAVQAAVAGARRDRPIVVWRGDWVRHEGQDGDGLASVREAILWAVAFAPPACRAQPVRGLVLISLAPAPGSSRLVLGADAWRWSDLLRSRAGGVARP